MKKLSDDEILLELQKISKILTFAYSEKIEEIISNVASTDERKITWVLLDGKTSNDELEKITGIKERGMRRILKAFADNDLINNPRGKPASRKIDYVPQKWVELLPDESEKEVEKHE